MGRARKNQREAQRRKRVKKRNKLGLGNDDDDALVLPYIGPVALGEAVIGGNKESKKQSTQEDSSANEQGDADKTNTCHYSDHQQSTCNAAALSLDNRDSKTTSAIIAANDKGSSTPTTSATIALKRPLDRIERMRLKKQMQKARRKEKKAAREGTT